MAGPLDGVRVLDFGQYIAGPLAAMLLADMGADVLHVDPPGGPRLLSPANATWNRGKRTVELDLKAAAGAETARRLAGGADVLIENFRPGVMDRLGLGTKPLAQANPRLLYCSLPGFAGDDPRAVTAAWEGVVAAATGTYSSRLDGGEIARPVYTAVPISSAYAAFIGAASIVMALIARERDGTGQQIEVPLFDATFTAIGVRGLIAHNAAAGPPVRGLAYVRQYQCWDGRWVQFHAANTRFITRFLRAAGVEGWIEEGLADRQRLAADPAADAEVLRRMQALFQTRTAQEWEDLVNAAGTPTAICRSSAEWLEHPHARGSAMIVEIDDPQRGRMLQPGINARMSASPGTVRPAAAQPEAASGVAWDLPSMWRGGAPANAGNTPNAAPAATTSAAGTAASSALAGVRVLDLCIILAGPTCGRTLAEFGADVIKIDDPNREGGIAFHQDVNRGKRSILLDLKSDVGREVFWQLLDRADVVVQNYRDGVVQRLGLDYEAVSRRKPTIVYASLNAYGHVGPWADRPGWEQLAQAATGMQARYGGDGQPVLQPYPINDYGTGVMGAFAVALALYHRQRTGEGQHVQTSLAYTACTLQSLFMQDYAGKVWDEPRGQDALGWGPLARNYRAADGWFFLAAPPAERETLASLLGLSSAPQADADLEAALENALARETVATWVELLNHRDHRHIGAHAQASVTQLMRDPWVQAHGLSLTREHDGAGSVTTNGPAPRLSRTPVQPGVPAPLPGADAASILDEAGMRDSLASLVERGIVKIESLPVR